MTDREAFEAWAHPAGYDISAWGVGGAYQDRATISAWHGWQAAWTASRLQALEEAARQCDLHDAANTGHVGASIAAAIRSLAGERKDA